MSPYPVAANPAMKMTTQYNDLNLVFALAAWLHPGMEVFCPNSEHVPLNIRASPMSADGD